MSFRLILAQNRCFLIVFPALLFKLFGFSQIGTQRPILAPKGQEAPKGSKRHKLVPKGSKWIQQAQNGSIRLKIEIVPKLVIIGPPKMVNTCKYSGKSLGVPLSSGTQIWWFGCLKMVIFESTFAILGPPKMTKCCQILEPKSQVLVQIVNQNWHSRAAK